MFPFLPIATSTNVERDFSRGGLMVSKHRHNLKDDSVRSAMTVSAWDDKGLVPRQDIIKHFNNRQKRLGTQHSTVSKGKEKEIQEVIDV